MKIALFSDTYIPDINGVATSTNILRNKRNGNPTAVPLFGAVAALWSAPD